jgi:hypothetical protein
MLLLLPFCPLPPQADLILSRLASSCRQSDPQLLSELRGELLYMARVIEEPVSFKVSRQLLDA